MHLHLPLLLLGFANLIFGLRNVTVDDVHPSIRYRPQGAWFMSKNSSLDYGYAHMLTQTPNSTATFNFTGVAIYFLSPLWPYHVTTAISLDSGRAMLIDLVDRSRPDTGGFGPETVNYAAVWSATGLNNTQHTLVMSIGDQEPFAVVDGLIYTILDDNPDSSDNRTSSIQSLTSPTRCSSTSVPTSGSAVPDAANERTTHVVVGSILGCLGLLIVLLFVWFCARRRKRPLSEAWTVASASRSTMPPVSSSSQRPQAIYWESGESDVVYPTHHPSSGQYPQQPPPTSQHRLFSGVPSSASSSYDHTNVDSHSSSDTTLQQMSTSPLSSKYVHGVTLSTIVENSPVTDGTSSLPRTPASEREPYYNSHSRAGEMATPFHHSDLTPRSSLRNISNQFQR